MPKSYKDICAEIAELHRLQHDLYDRLDEGDDPYNDIVASIDEIDDRIDELVEERDAIIHASLGF